MSPRAACERVRGMQYSSSTQPCSHLDSRGTSSKCCTPCCCRQLLSPPSSPCPLPVPSCPNCGAAGAVACTLPG
eukprot:scaffold11766_cov23-Tisochrysis_lutea.AAC.1